MSKPEIGPVQGHRRAEADCLRGFCSALRGRREESIWSPRLRWAVAATVIATLAGAIQAPAGAIQAPAGAQCCEQEWSRPFLCSVEVDVLRGGERPRSVDLRRGLRLQAGEQVELELLGRDQAGRRFPADRMGVEVELDRRCPAGLEVQALGQGRLLVVAGARRGSCQMLLWVPGNLNLEWLVQLEVGGREASGYSRSEAEFLTRQLYQALLGRDPEPEALHAAAAEIQRGRLASQVRSMVQSPEYRSKAAGRSAAATLEQIYEGLLGRPPDSGGVRTYLRQIERGDVAGVVLSIVQSEEFEELMLGARR